MSLLKRDTQTILYGISDKQFSPEMQSIDMAAHVRGRIYLPDDWQADGILFGEHVPNESPYRPVVACDRYGDMIGLENVMAGFSYELPRSLAACQKLLIRCATSKNAGKTITIILKT